ncbi:MAG TPA: hypothetical protein VK946_02045 [Methylotenera sp.]|nr:hypothetical protein [Methylotenera sp.]
MKIHLFTLFAMLLAIGGCATEPPPRPQFVVAANQNLPPPPQDRAQIVFLEPINSIQGMFPVGIFEINDNNRTLLATTGAHSKVALLFTPGRHILMANQPGIAAHFLDANVEAGKRYYVLLRFIYANGFQMRPLRSSGPSDYAITNKDFPRWISETRFVDKTTDSDAFFEKYNEAVIKSQTSGWKTWLAKTPQQRAELTLNLEDAITY